MYNNSNLSDKCYVCNISNYTNWMLEIVYAENSEQFLWENSEQFNLTQKKKKI